MDHFLWGPSNCSFLPHACSTCRFSSGSQPQELGFSCIGSLQSPDLGFQVCGAASAIPSIAACLGSIVLVVNHPYIAQGSYSSAFGFCLVAGERDCPWAGFTPGSPAHRWGTYPRLVVASLERCSMDCTQWLGRRRWLHPRSRYPHQVHEERHAIWIFESRSDWPLPLRYMVSPLAEHFEASTGSHRRLASRLSSWLPHSHLWWVTGLSHFHISYAKISGHHHLEEVVAEMGQ